MVDWGGWDPSRGSLVLPAVVESIRVAVEKEESAITLESDRIAALSAEVEIVKGMGLSIAPFIREA